METPETQVAINIVAWNSMAYLPSFLKTLDEQSVPLRITIVDNASTDGMGVWMASNYPHVGTLRNMRNYGFARAHNQAILLALSSWQEADLSQRYILVCNADIEFDEHCINNLVQFMNAHPEIDACTPKLLRAHLQYSDVDNKMTVRTNVLDATGLSVSRALRVYDRGAGEDDRGQYDQTLDVFGCTGACAMYRASSLQRASHDLQFFDEDLFAYKEDVDVAWRMRHLGMKTAYVPQAIAWHHRMAKALSKVGWLEAWRRRRTKPAFINYLSTRNHCWVLVKNLTSGEFVHSCLWFLPYEAAKSFTMLVSWSTLRGYIDAMLGLPSAWRKRRRIIKSIPAVYKDLSAWFI